MNFKMYGKFVIWLLKKLFNIGIVEAFFSTKKMIRLFPGLAVLGTVFGAAIACLGTAIVLFLLGKDISFDGSYGGAYVAATSIDVLFFVAASVSVLYDKFLAEYGKTFELLKKEDYGS